MGDTEGHNKLCGLVGGNGNPLCRYCDCKRNETRNPRVKYRFTCTSKIQDCIRKGAAGCHEVRRRMGYYCLLHNGFDGIEFCDDERGLNGALPPEILHFFQLGYMTYALNGFFTAKK
jgi:hypothetical protein